MDGATIKQEIPESLMTDDITHNVAGTDLTISALYYSGTNDEGATELKLENPKTNSVKNEEQMGDDFIDSSLGMISDLIVIAPQKDNYHKFEVSINRSPNAPDHEGEIKQDNSAVKQEVKQEIMEVVIKKEETFDVCIREIYNNQTIKEEIHDCKESIKLEDDMTCPCVDNINATVKTEGQSVVMMNELSEEELQQDIVESERFDGNFGQSHDWVSGRTGEPRNHHRTVKTTSSDMGTHAGDKHFACATCNKSFSDQYYLKVHQRIHTGEKPYACTMCDKSFRDQSAVKVHQRTHTGEKPYGCSMCDKRFTASNSLKRHQRIHTEEKPYAYTMCDMRFKNLSSLNGHHRSHIGGEKPYRCTICDKSFGAHQTLQRHQRIHTGEKPYGCTMCDKNFSYKSDLTVHQRTHTGEKPYGCTMCDERFKSRQELQRHQRTHTEEKPYECTMCDKSFSTRQTLQGHKRTHIWEKPLDIHTEKPYGCTMCDQGFTSSDALQVHQRTHT